MKRIGALITDIGHDIEMFFTFKSMILTSLSGLVLAFIKKYVFEDFNFLIYLGILILCDSLSKALQVYEKKEKWDWEVAFTKPIEKMIKYFIYLITMHILIVFEVMNRAQDWTGDGTMFLIRYICFGALIAREVSSILKNLGIATPEKIQFIFDFFKTKKQDGTD